MSHASVQERHVRWVYAAAVALEALKLTLQFVSPRLVIVLCSSSIHITNSYHISCRISACLVVCLSVYIRVFCGLCVVNLDILFPLDQVELHEPARRLVASLSYPLRRVQRGA